MLASVAPTLSFKNHNSKQCEQHCVPVKYMSDNNNSWKKNLQKQIPAATLLRHVQHGIPI